MIFAELKQHINPHKGTEFKAYRLADFFSGEVRKRVQRDEDSQRLEDELKYENWYVVDQFYGTGEEKGLIEFIKDTIGNLQVKYKEVYLLRNEEQYKIYDFNTGKGFQPDFILFLKNSQFINRYRRPLSLYEFCTVGQLLFYKFYVFKYINRDVRCDFFR